MSVYLLSLQKKCVMLISSILFFLLLIALFAGAELAFVSASKLRIQLKREKGSKRGEILARFYEKPSDFIGAMLVGLNIALVAITSLMTELIEPYLAPFIHSELLLFLIITIIITLIVLLIGEFIPKILFRSYADDILFHLAIPLRFFLFILAPISWVMTRFAKGILRLFGNTAVEHEETSFSAIDLEDFVKNTRTSTEEEIDTQLFGNALYLREVKAKTCMVPRSEIVWIDVTATVDDLIKIFADTKLSKIIVCEGDLDNVLGYVHHHQMLHRPKTIKQMLMNISIIPETMRADQLLAYFTKQRLSLACVVDEFGSTAGVISIEDILEQIFGDIEDEYDTEDQEYLEEQINEHEFRFAARLDINYLNEKYAPVIDFPEGDYSTLSGYIVITRGDIPEQGDVIALDNYEFYIEQVADTKIETVRVKRIYNEI
jgi:putative hemolysin